MAESSVPVDLLNPGQVFACIGLLEAAELLLGGAEGGFDWTNPRGVRFFVRSQGSEPPVKTVLAFLDRAEVLTVAPVESACVGGWVGSWGPAPVQLERAQGYPFPDPESPATLMCQLTDGAAVIPIDHWGDATTRDNVKFWAGAGGYPGSALARDALLLVRGKAAQAVDEPFAFAASQSSSFRLDWRRDYIPLQAGFSLNAHTNVETIGFPLVELLAAIGLTHARPRRPERRNKLAYEYAVMGRSEPEQQVWLPLTMLRAALGGAPLPFPMRRFRMFLDWPGKEGQARSITTVTEETVT